MNPNSYLTVKYMLKDIRFLSGGEQQRVLIAHVPAGTPDLILMDVVMPGMSGFQATRKLMRNPDTRDIPILMLTTKDQESDRAWGLRNGAREYFVKPPEKEALLAQIKTLI